MHYYSLFIDPIQPPAPVILERSSTTMTLSLQPLEDENIRYVFFFTPI